MSTPIKPTITVFLEAEKEKNTATASAIVQEAEKVDGSPFSDHAIGYLAPTAAITQEAIEEPSHPVEHPADDEEVFF